MIALRSVVLLVLIGLVGLACHIEQETDPTGPGSHLTQVIRFVNLASAAVLVQIPDAHHEFELGVGDARTVEVHSEQEAAVFFVRIISLHPGQDTSVAPRWTGFVEVGKTVNIQHISRIYIE